MFDSRNRGSSGFALVDPCVGIYVLRWCRAVCDQVWMVQKSQSLRVPFVWCPGCRWFNVGCRVSCYQVCVPVMDYQLWFAVGSVKFGLGVVFCASGNIRFQDGQWPSVLSHWLYGMGFPSLRAGFRTHTACRFEFVGYICYVFHRKVWHGLSLQSAGLASDTGIIRRHPLGGW